MRRVAAAELEAIITREDVVWALQRDPSGQMTVREAGTSPPVVVFPDELIFDAVQRMLRGGYGRLAVVDRDNPRKIVGYFGRASVMSSLLQRLQEENEREPAWTPWRRERRSTPHAAQEKQEAKE